jgi:hypothetical protein
VLLAPSLAARAAGDRSCCHGVVVVASSFPSEPDFVQQSLSVNSNFVIDVIGPLVADSAPQRLVLLVTFWLQTMAILSFKLNDLFALLVPEFVQLVHDVGAFNFPIEPDFVQAVF